MNYGDLRSLFEHVATMLDQQSDQMLKERLGIGISQYRVLVTIENTNVPTQRIVAERLGFTEAGISRQIKILLEKGHILRKVNPQNRRENMLQLTAKGKRLLHVAQEDLDLFAAKSFRDIDQKHLKTMREQLQKAHNTMCTSQECGHRAYMV